MSGADYTVEIDSLVAVLVPLEESAAAAKRVKDHKDQLAGFLKDTGSADVTAAGKDFLESWGYGMGKLVEYAEDIAEKLNETINAYVTAEKYGVEGFTPIEENLGSVPVGWATDKAFRGRQIVEQYGEGMPDPADNPLNDKGKELQQDFEDWAFGRVSTTAATAGTARYRGTPPRPT
ncbi:hypothetical protein GCM10010406_49050 [Streptomyces thermolineatus]|uniref:WXG100 family type VII secretion target n=1 Tax=Streptomyces thermolineatus TaxID=44033 RepID=A0ABP5ZXN3_9ACTN